MATGLALEVAGQVQRRLVALRAGQPAAGVAVAGIAVAGLGAEVVAHECTVKKRSLTWPS